MHVVTSMRCSKCSSISGDKWVHVEIFWKFANTIHSVVLQFQVKLKEEENVYQNMTDKISLCLEIHIKTQTYVINIHVKKWDTFFWLSVTEGSVFTM